MHLGLIPRNGLGMRLVVTELLALGYTIRCKRLTDCTVVVGRGGLAIALVTQYDIQRVKNIEAEISKLL